jgi:Fe-S cluster assembly scaffold protein SufB
MMDITKPTTIHLTDTTPDVTLNVAPNVEVIIIETSQHSTVTLDIGENATVHYIYLCTSEADTVKSAHLQANAVIHWRSALLGGNSKQEIVTYHTGNGAHSTHHGIFLGRAHDRFLMNYWNQHSAEHTAGHILVHGVLFDYAYADFKGNIKIDQTSKDTEASLTEETILLGHRSRSDSIPQLEIATNDVRASHSSAITRIDEEQLFYLQSRGLEIEEGKRMIVRGFLESIVGGIQDEGYKEKVTHLIEERLMDLTQ